MNYASSLTGAFWTGYYKHPFLSKFLIAFFIFLVGISIFAPVASAWEWTDLLGTGFGALGLASKPGSVLANALNDMGLVLFDIGNRDLQYISVSAATSAWDSLLGTSAFAAVRLAFATVMKTCGYSILIIIFLIQLIKVGNKLDGNASVPGFKEVIFLLIYFAIFKFLIDNSFEFCGAFYDAFNLLASTLEDRMAGFDTFTNNLMANAIIPAQGETTIGSGFILIIEGFGYMFICVAAAVVAQVIILARSIQLYVYAIISPIPLSLLGYEGTRSYAMGFIKNFIALCLTGVIIVASMMLFQAAVPYFFNGETFAFSGTVLAPIIFGILLIFSLVKSGSWAREVLGG